MRGLVPAQQRNIVPSGGQRAVRRMSYQYRTKRPAAAESTDCPHYFIRDTSGDGSALATARVRPAGAAAHPRWWPGGRQPDAGRSDRGDHTRRRLRRETNGVARGDSEAVAERGEGRSRGGRWAAAACLATARRRLCHLIKSSCVAACGLFPGQRTKPRLAGPSPGAPRRMACQGASRVTGGCKNAYQNCIYIMVDTLVRTTVSSGTGLAAGIPGMGFGLAGTGAMPQQPFGQGAAPALFRQGPGAPGAQRGQARRTGQRGQAKRQRARP